MANDLTYYLNHPRFQCAVAAENDEAPSFHRSLTQYYAPTPLVRLSRAAQVLGIGSLFVKDESQRFGIGSFKGLGGSFAAAKVLCARYDLSFSQLLSQKERLREVTLVTATDGNHGRGVAWVAHILGCRAVVYLPAGAAVQRVRNICALGATAEVLPCNYDAAVRHAARMAEKNGWILLQDTAWQGYEEIPRAIMQGYTTLAAETVAQLGEHTPTHLFLQAGVGSMAGAITAHFRAHYGEKCPKIIIVEPNNANCLFRSAQAGRICTVTGALDSIMAGLCCGEPCTLSWELLRDSATAFVSCADRYAVRGMRALGRPIGEDPAIISGESGAVTMGVLQAIMTDFALLREALRLNADSCVLLISTEGDTDPENYRRIMEGNDGEND